MAKLWRVVASAHDPVLVGLDVTRQARLTAADIDRLAPLSAGNETVVLTRSTAPWIEPGQCLVVSDVTFEQLIGSTNWSQYSATVDLVRATHNPSLGVAADVPLRVHARFVALWPSATRGEQAAALLHDVGKVVSGLGWTMRVLATVVGPRGARFGAYHDHERLGAAMLEGVSEARTVELVAGSVRDEARAALCRADDI